MEVLLSRASRVLGLAVTMAALLVYLRTMAPGLTWAHNGADGGDLAAAVMTGGIPHPPGYPTYMLLGRLFAAIPIADVAWRLNLLSVVCAAATIAILFALAYRILSPSPLQGEGRDEGASSLAAAVAALAFALSPVFWSQALITEVYTLHILFVAGLLYAAARGWAGRPLFWLAYGLGLGNHLTLLLLAPWLWLLARRTSTADSPQRHQNTSQRRHGSPGHWSMPACLLAMLLGLCAYLYLPLRAAAGPLVNWGDPRTLDRFLWLVTAAPYQGYAFGLPLAELPSRLAAWAGLLAQQFTWLGVALALVGLWDLLALPDRRWAWATLAAFIAYSVYALLYRTADSYVYMLPAYLSVALWLGRGVLLVWQEVRSRADRLAPLAAALLLAIPFYQAWTQWPELDLSRDDEARAYVRSVLSELPHGSLVITTSDEHTFALWYGVAAVARDDVTVVDRDLTQFEWYRRQIEHRLPAPAWQTDIDSVVTYTVAFARTASAQRPVFLSGDDAALRAALPWRARGTLWELTTE